MINGLTVLILTQFILQFIIFRFRFRWSRERKILFRNILERHAVRREDVPVTTGVSSTSTRASPVPLCFCAAPTQKHKGFCAMMKLDACWVCVITLHRGGCFSIVLLYSSSVYVFGSRAGEPPAPGRHLSSAASVGMLEGGLQTRLLLRGEWWYAL